MSIGGVDPLQGPSFTAPSVGFSSSSAAQEQAAQFAALMRAQMGSMITSAALGGFGDNNSGGGGLFGNNSSMGGLGGSFGSAFGGGGGMSSLLLMQTLQPLTEALNRLTERLDALEGDSDLEVSRVPIPETLPHRNLIERMADRYQVPAAFLGAVMMAESSGDPAAVGDEGKSVGLFQLHEQGMGAGLGDLRLDPELNATIGARGLAEGWHDGLRRGIEGENLVRFAYDYRFNPGGGFGYQGDAILSNFEFYETLAQRNGLA